MDTLYFHYFSATGNTARAVTLGAEALRALGHTVTLLPINAETLAQPPVAHHTAVHVIAFPVLGFGPPDNVKRYIRRLARRVTKETGLRAAVFATCAGEPFQALEETEKMLRRKGFSVLASGFSRYPLNWLQVATAPDEASCNTILVKGDNDTRNFVRSLAGQLVGAPEKTAASLFRTGIFNQLWSGLVQLLFGRLGRHFLATFFVATPSCSGCTICAAGCPVKTISMRSFRTAGRLSRPVWGLGCNRCNLCINRCPEQAIQVSIAKLVIHCLINFAALAVITLRLPDLIGLLTITNPVISNLMTILVGLGLFTFTCLAQLGPLDWLLTSLARSRPLGGLFNVSYTAGFRRYRAPVD